MHSKSFLLTAARLGLAATWLLSLSAKADIFFWYPDMNGSSAGIFSDVNHWYNNTTNTPPPYIEPGGNGGPPGGGDDADLGSGATVAAGSIFLNRLSGGAGTVLTLNGDSTVTTLSGNFSLSGSGTLTATNVPLAPFVVGGRLVVESFTDRGLSVRAGGYMKLQGSIVAEEGDTVNVFVDGAGSFLLVEGAVSEDVTGAIQGGGAAQFERLDNLKSTAPTLEVSGSGSSLTLQEASIVNGSLDVFSGGSLLIHDGLILDGGKIDGQALGGGSNWSGDGTDVVVQGKVTAGVVDGFYDLNVRAKAKAIIGDGLTLSLAKGCQSTLTAEDTGTELSITGRTQVGAAGEGTLTVKTGAKATLIAPPSQKEVFLVGKDSGSKGVVTVQGSGATLNTLAMLARIGYSAGSTGEILIDGGTLNMGNIDGQDPIIVLGSSGKGTLTLRNGGLLELVTPNPEIYIAADKGSVGQFTITNSSFAKLGTNFGTVYLGLLGSGRADVSNQASVICHELAIAAEKGGSGTLNVSDNASWECKGYTYVGKEPKFDGTAIPGGTGQLNVRSGGVFRTPFLDVSASGLVTVRDTGRIAVGLNALGPAGTLRVDNLGILFGKGRVRAPVLVGPTGNIEPGASPGTLTIEGDYTHEGGGTLNIQLGGTGAKADLLKVTGQANVTGGTLKVSLTGGFNPKEGQKFKILTATKVIGQFATVEGADPNVEYEETGITVTPLITPSTLTVTIDPANPVGGSVSAGFLGATPRNVGFTYKISAKPATGLVFSGWTGSLTSTNPNLTFVMVPNMTLQANFVANPFVPQILGKYAGLATNAAETLAGGLLNITFNKGGSFSAKFALGGKSYSFGGIFTGLGKYQRQLVLSGKQFVIDLTAALDASGTVNGTITVNGAASAVATQRATYTAATPTDRAGDYTVAFPADSFPGGTGWATVNIKPAGAVKLAGFLADGSKLSAGGTLAPDGTFPVLISLYKGLGVFSGTLTFAAPPRSSDPSVSDVTGSMTWTKPEESKNLIFPNSFSQTLISEGSFYAPLAKDERIFSNLNTNGDAELRFTGGDLAADIEKAIILSIKNAVTYPNPSSAADKLKLTFTAKTGAFAGSFLHPGTGKAKAFTGVVLRKQQRGGGYFLDATDSGQVELAAP